MQFTADITGVELVVVRRARIVGARRRDGRHAGTGHRRVRLHDLAALPRSDARSYRPQMDRDTSRADSIAGWQSRPVKRVLVSTWPTTASSPNTWSKRRCRSPPRPSRWPASSRPAPSPACPAKPTSCASVCRPRRIDRAAGSRVAQPSLPGAAKPQAANGKYQRGRVRISFPLENMGPNLPTIISTVAGNLFELRLSLGPAAAGPRISRRRLRSRFSRPAVRRRRHAAADRRLRSADHRHDRQAEHRPDAAATADLVRTLGEAGIDFVKDDELMANPPHSPLAERVKAVMHVVNELADATGRKLMFAFNISDQLDRMLEHHDTVRRRRRHVRDGQPQQRRLRGGRLSCGGGRRCRSTATATAGACSRATRRSAWSSPPIKNSGGSPASISCTSTASRTNSASRTNRSCARSRPASRRCSAATSVMPVVSSGQWGGQAPETYRQTQTLDLMYLAGGGILAHPGGPAAGVAAIRQAWEAAAAGVAARRVCPRSIVRAAPIARILSARLSIAEVTQGINHRSAFGLLRRRLHRLDRRARSAHARRRRDGAVRRAAERRDAARGIRTSAPSASPATAARCRPSEMDAALPDVFESLCATSTRDRSLQSLLDVRFVAADRQHRPGDRHRPPRVSEPLRAAGGRRAGACSDSACSAIFSRRSGLDSPVYRLDRHPTMRHHPVTPMTEADLRVHLSHQTDRPIDLVDVLALDAGYEAAAERLRAAHGATAASCSSTR